jgi:hypothetical protein
VTHRRRQRALGPRIAGVVLGVIFVLLPPGVRVAGLGSVPEAMVGAFGSLPTIDSVLAATPAPTEPVGGDTRSPQEGPGLVGNPVGAILGVIGLGLIAVIGTTAYIRLTGGPGIRRR